jgi:hypothetical protein
MRLPGTWNPKEGAGWARALLWDGPTYRLEGLATHLPAFVPGQRAVWLPALDPAPLPSEQH